MAVSTQEQIRTEEVLNVLKNSPDDFLYIRYAEVVCYETRSGRPPQCCAILPSMYGSAVQLVPNGFLLGGSDVIALQEASVGPASDADIEERAKAYEYRAVRLAASCPQDQLSETLVAVYATKTAYWLTRAAALREARQVGVPVSPADQLVRSFSSMSCFTCVRLHVR